MSEIPPEMYHSEEFTVKFTGAKESSHSVSLPGLQRVLSRAISVTLHLLCLRVFIAVTAFN